MVVGEIRGLERAYRAVFVSLLILALLASIPMQPGASALADSIEFTLPHSDHPLDVDGNGLFEYLLFNLALRVGDPDWYLIVGWLYSSEQSIPIASATNLSFHEAGVGSVELWFQGGLLCAAGLDGPYVLKMYAYNHNYSTLFSQSTYLTGGYLHDEFSEPTHFEVQMPHSDEGVDTDSDGLFNYLVVTIPIHVMNRDYYDIRASIATCVTENSTALMNESTGAVSIHILLDKGIQMVPISFNGALFEDIANDTGFMVFVSLMESGFGWPISWDYTTKNYTGSQFLNPTACFSPPHSDWALDSDGDGVKDYLAIGASVEVQEEGNYTVTGSLSIEGVVNIAVTANRTYIGVGHNSVVLLYSGSDIFMTRYNGTFQVQLVLSSDSGSTLYSNLYETSAYQWILFSSVPSPTIAIEPGIDVTEEYVFNASSIQADGLVADISEARWDWDGDGNWDTDWSTNLTVSHTFAKPGVYTVRLQVRDDLGRMNQTSITVTVQPPSGKVELISAKNAFPFIAILVISLVAVTFGLVFAMPLEPLVIAILSLLVPLFSRIKGEDALSNYRRGMIHGCILAHPGISFSEMRASLSISSGSLVYHLEVLKKSGKIVSRKSGATVRFYSAEMNIPKSVQMGLTHLQLRILRYLHMHGQATVREMRDALSASRQAIHNGLTKLKTDRLVISVMYGPRRLYELAPGVDHDFACSFSEESSGDVVGGIPFILDGDKEHPTRDSTRSSIPSPANRPLSDTANIGQGDHL